VGDSIISLVKKLRHTNDTLQSFLTNVSKYQTQEHDRLVARKASDSKLQELEDKIETLFTLAGDPSVQGPDDIITLTDSIFADEGGKVVFSSIHRAKGLEAHTVIILPPDLLPMVRKNQSEREYTQELNIKYVALTRSKNTLVFIPKPTDGD
jgi:superfamily I DNA/RNA helicase